MHQNAPSAFSMVVRGQNVQTRRLNAVLYGGQPHDASFDVGQGSVGLVLGAPVQTTFKISFGGTISQIDLPHLVNPLPQSLAPKGSGKVVVRLYDAVSNQVLAQGTLTVDDRSTKTS